MQYHKIEGQYILVHKQFQRTVLEIVAISIVLIFLYSCGFQVADQGRGIGTQSNSVLNFGAVGDSITDDTEAIQRAVDSGNGNIIFSKGTYRVTHPIVINLSKIGPVAISGGGAARIIMEGEGAAFKFIGMLEGTADPTTVQPNVLYSERMPLIDGLEIIGKHPKAVGIQAIGTIELTITRVLVQKALHGIHLTGRNRNVIISECHLYWNHGIGIYMDNVNLHQINIVNNHISYNGGGGIVVRKGEVRNLQIGSCDIEGNMSKSGRATANVFIDITKGSMLEGAIVGCTIQHTSDVPESSNIRFIGHGGEERTKTGNFTIANNILSDVQYNIHIEYGRGFIITGNTFWKGYTHNILIQQSDDINIGSNVLDRNPDYRSTDSKNNIVIRKSKNVTISGVHINQEFGGIGGIVLDQCQNYNLMNSTILNWEGSGILLKESMNGKVSGNFINNDHHSGGEGQIAILVEKGKANLILNNYTNGIIKGESFAAKIVNNFGY